MSGPDPLQNREISVSFWDIEIIDLSHYFMQYTKDFQSTFLDSYSSFLHAAYHRFQRCFDGQVLLTCCSSANGKGNKYDGSKDKELDEPETNNSSVDGNLSDTCQPSILDVEAILGDNEVNKEELHHSQDMDKIIVPI
ncbi:hypothetical protein PAXINDRAFT_19691 [Paxillus involutus ATCC 200175]|uniref:Uncharacterized protein n=1 Tax=Paxillus involutus ATCC 200175 TaxID=664439 RepID=A0A0C9TIJ5_PAXIN|nr:hypothetical protein PAXINDRAFT_19691 [Paxillus involutus ATCC 200175]